MTNALPLLIFDLDGTLVDSVGDIRIAANLLLTEFGRGTLPESAVRGMVGEGARRLVEKLLAASPGTPVSIDAAYTRFLELYEALPTEKTTLYPGVVATLEALAMHGHELALCTNKPTGATRTVLRDLDLARFFKKIVCGDSHEFRKPDPRMIEAIVDSKSRSVLFIGDSEVDSEIARAVGIPCALVTYGYHQKPIEEIPADIRLNAFTDLPAWVSRASGGR